MVWLLVSLRLLLLCGDGSGGAATNEDSDESLLSRQRLSHGCALRLSLDLSP